MDEKEKLRILIPHWITHNEEHAKEYRDWGILLEESLPELKDAADAVEMVNKSLIAALEKLGGGKKHNHS